MQSQWATGPCVASLSRHRALIFDNRSARHALPVQLPTGRFDHTTETGGTDTPASSGRIARAGKASETQRARQRMAHRFAQSSLLDPTHSRTDEREPPSCRSTGQRPGLSIAGKKLAIIARRPQKKASSQMQITMRSNPATNHDSLPLDHRRTTTKRCIRENFLDLFNRRRLSRQRLLFIATPELPRPR
jgi:hypothetical protein